MSRASPSTVVKKTVTAMSARTAKHSPSSRDWSSRAETAIHPETRTPSCDVGAVPFPMGHYIENIGTTMLRFLEIFRSEYFADVSFAQWLAFTPHELVRAHLNIEESVLAKIPSSKTPVVGG
jgi:hypothetical protein